MTTKEFTELQSKIEEIENLALEIQEMAEEEDLRWKANENNPFKEHWLRQNSYSLQNIANEICEVTNGFKECEDNYNVCTTD